MNITWNDVGKVTKAGRYPFRDGTVEILEIEIAMWKRDPSALFRLMRKTPLRGKPEYVLGETVVDAGIP